MPVPDYKEMYLKLFRASEDAVNLLVSAQRECEEMYISEPEAELKILHVPETKPENGK